MKRLCCAAFLAAVPFSAVFAEVDAGDPAQLMGVWRGTSTCTDRVALPACHDETVVYEFTAGPRPGTLHWMADKVVNGKREEMGGFDLAYDKAEACWKAEYSSPRGKTVWRVWVEGARLWGDARLVPGDQKVRKLEARKEGH